MTFVGAIQGTPTLGAGITSAILPAFPAWVQVICWDTTWYDSNGFITAPGELTIPAEHDGTYRVRADFDLQATAAADDREVEIGFDVNGTMVYTRIVSLSGAHAIRFSISVEAVLWGMNEGSTIKVYGRTYNSASNLTPKGTYTRARLVLQYLGA